MNKLFSVVRWSIFAQVVVVSLVSIVLMLLIILVLFQTSVLFRIFPAALEKSAESVSELIFLVENVPEEVEPVVLSSFSGPARLGRILPGFPEGARQLAYLEDGLVKEGTQAAAVLGGRELRFDYVPLSRIQAEEIEPIVAISVLDITIALDDGRVLSVMFSPAALFSSMPTPIIAILLIATLSISGVTIVLIRQAFRPLRRLEESATRVGYTPDPEHVEETGAEEIRRVARALNRMQDRVQGLVSERTRMFYSLAHDIRTGLTRIRLRLDEVPVGDREAVERDLDQMQSVIEDMLTFARADQPAGRQEVVNLARFARSYADDAPGGLAQRQGKDGTDITIAADPVALRRALDNLVDNARAYAQDVSLSWLETGAGFEIRVEDRGPGIPDDQMAGVFEPFFRMERSRNRDTGGSGLGLGIARALVRAQGGDLILRNRDGGGLSAIILFPERCYLA